MSENNIEQTEKEKYCNKSIPKVKEIVKMNKVHSKILCSLKIIALIFLFIILIFGLFFLAAYFFLSKKSKESEKNQSLVNSEKQEPILTIPNQLKEIPEPFGEEIPDCQPKN